MAAEGLKTAEASTPPAPEKTTVTHSETYTVNGRAVSREEYVQASKEMHHEMEGLFSESKFFNRMHGGLDHKPVAPAPSHHEAAAPTSRFVVPQAAQSVPQNLPASPASAAMDGLKNDLEVITAERMRRYDPGLTDNEAKLDTLKYIAFSANGFHREELKEQQGHDAPGIYMSKGGERIRLDTAAEDLPEAVRHRLELSARRNGIDIHTGAPLGDAVKPAPHVAEPPQEEKKPAAREAVHPQTAPPEITAPEAPADAKPAARAEAPTPVAGAGNAPAAGAGNAPVAGAGNMELLGGNPQILLLFAALLQVVMPLLAGKEPGHDHDAVPAATAQAPVRQKLAAPAR